ncbi:Insulin-like growth factor-binding protein complex acid labile subunit [Folsomia candida]|uniref:Insulin-like growth factor-binding protein complex acid labile subunit n=1 Tax=Folsomia candida TaxID=158441 RepID=A0A226DAR1_FOLCA|nr:Insulin-like growth factor-binding protein complex acid labile subunit [Folsomia candida]
MIKIFILPPFLFNFFQLKSLTIRTQNTEWRASSAGLEVEQGSFEGQGQLEYLSLAENNLWSLGESKNALCPLRNLVHLNVSYNRLSDIEELISASPVVSRSESGENLCALNVQNVDVSHNHIRRVGHNAFSNFPRMSELRLQNNLISELEDTAFTGLGQIKLLNLSSNRIVALPPTIFQSNGNIREIFLQNNTISAISSRVFSGLENLLSLDLSRNTLTSQWIKEDIFQGLSRLVILKLSSNQLSYVDGSIFKDLISLQSLSLERNKIDTIHPTAFNSLRNLHFLDLSFNRLSHIDSRVFSNLVVLSQLTLDHNKIRSLEDNALKNCSSISDLILANNRLLNVPVAIKSLSYLKTLDIGENLITHVNNASFTGMVQLIGLRMVDNRIESLPSGFCSSMKKLRVLNLSQNKIREISSSAFISCPELRVLRLDTNSLQELPPTLAPQLPSLLWLNVSENQIRSADYRLLPPSTEWLDLSYNVIETLGPISRNVTHDQRSSSLRVMDISYNRLKSLDQSGIPASLETLRINHNSQFKTVEPNTFLASTQLRRVELIGNQIEILPLEALQLPQIPSGRMLPDFYLANNPFTQNCQMEWLTRTHQLTVLRTHPHIVDLDAILLRPTFPRPNQAVSLMDTRAQDFLCPYKSHCFALCHCCEFEFCDCEMSCPDNCTCYHDNSWSSNIVVCSNLQYENVPEKIPMDSSELYLDGNNISQLGSHIFIGKKNLLSLYLNGSNVESIKNKTFNGLKALQTLNLQDNFLSELNGYEFADLENIREIYLQNNEIVTIHKDTFANLKFLQVLRIDGNLIVDFNVWELSANGYLNSVMLANNPWNCDCDFLIPFRNWVASKTTIVADFSLATCQIYYAEDEDHQHDGVMSKFSPSTNHQLQPTISSMCNFASNADITFNYEQNGNNELLEINNHISSMGGAAEKVAGPVGPLPPPSENHSNFSRLDTNSADNTFWALLLCLTAFLIVILVILAIFRQEIYYWARNGLLNGGESSGGFLANLLNCCCCCPEKYSGTHHPGGAGGKNLCPSTMLDDQEKLFDAYFLYAKRDEDMLIQKIVPELEDPTTASTTPGHKFRLCLHYRDLCLSPESPWNREMILSACDASKR